MIITIVNALIFFVSTVCRVLEWILIIRIVLSWVGVSPHTHYNEILGAIYQVSDYIMIPFRRIPLRIGMLDLTPILAFMVLHIIPQLFAALMYTLIGAA